MTSSTPTYNSDGEQVWKPSVGQFFKPASVKRDSYGGIIGALQDQAVDFTGTTKAYPENFAGIIAAIKDLQIAAEDGPGSNTGPYPPDFNVIINPITGLPEYDYTEPPENGMLWFDTRQGRLFVWVDDDWYQTNGADGLPIVTDTNNPPGTQYLVPGQTWWDKESGALYIFDGRYAHGDGSIDETQGADGVPVWVPIDQPSEGTIQTTTDLPLGNKTRSLVVDTPDNIDSILYPVDINNFTVQSDYNIWAFAAIKTLEDAVIQDRKSPGVSVAATAPTGSDLVPGSLWFDTSTLDLSVYYDDGDSNQWVSINNPYSSQAITSTINRAITSESAARTVALSDLNIKLDQIYDKDRVTFATIDSRLDELKQAIEYELSVQGEFAAVSTTDNLAIRVHALENAEIDLSGYVQTDDLSLELLSIEHKFSTLPYLEQSEIEALFPDMSHKVEQSDIDTAIANITTEYLPRTGGTLTGSFVIEKEDVSEPAFDVSSSASNSRDLFKLKSFNTQDKASTFGATTELWELAWKFGGEEDFAWIYNDTNKVFSVTKDGPACSQLYIGSFNANTEDGRSLSANTIEVGERIRKFEQVFADMRAAVVSATDLDTLKSGLMNALTNV